MKATARKARSGLTLVEVMTMMATLTVILGLTVGLFEMMFRLADSGRRHVATEAALARVARVFRADVRAARSVRKCDPGASSEALEIVPEGGDRLIHYAIGKDEVRRVEWDGLDVVEEERFALPAEASARFEREDVEGRSLLALTLDRRPGKARGAGEPRRFRVQAASGVDSRFSGREVAR